ncbi:MAG: flagellar hook-length control protein FliK [Rhodospirillaceae bacterium]
MNRSLGATPVAAVAPIAALHRLQTDLGAPARLVPGTRLFLQVIEPLTEGGVRARVVNGTAEHRLPFDAKIGARLQVLVAGTAEQPTFVLVEEEASGIGLSLSQAARVLAALAPGQGVAARPPIVRGAAPLVTGQGIEVPALARALAEAIGRSGLFYEAHQAQWANGTRDRAALLDEPQAKLTLREVPVDAVSTRGPAHATSSGMAASELNGIVHRDTVPLVQQQLAALETGALVWRGEAWRGQEVEWTVQRDARHEHDDDGNHGHWHTRVRLTLPELGTVDAALAIDAHGLDVCIAATQAEAATALRDAAAALVRSLDAAGINVRRLEIQHGA